jgi:hypothetical protein
MKSFLLPVRALLSLAPAFAKGPTEFAEIPFGANKGTVRQVIESRPDVAFEGEAGSLLSFRGGTFANEIVSTWQFNFIDESFRSARVNFTPQPGTDGRYFLNDLIEWRVVALIEEKYGKSTRAEDENHREYNWNFPDKQRPGWTKTIRVFHGWASSRIIEVVYAEIPPVLPKAKTKDI